VIRSGDITPLVTSAARRNPAIPGVPTMTEKGHADASLSTWAELWAPAKTPRPVIDRLSQALDKTMKDPAVVAAIEKAGLQVEYNDPAATLKLVDRENEIVRTVARKLGLGK
jgi:tripartite-type tricarboxylate transporter receptor subunit TctC